VIKSVIASKRQISVLLINNIMKKTLKRAKRLPNRHIEKIQKR